MKKFLRNITIFSLPIIILLASMEVLVSAIPNSYAYKSNYIKNKGKRIEALAIGHSQLYDGFCPGMFSIPSFNLCNSAQEYVDDYYLLEEFLPYMPNLKLVILPIGYVNVTTKDSDTTLTERSCYYHKYMGINYGGRLPLAYYYECLMPFKALTKAESYYRYHEDMVRCDSLGRRNNHSKRSNDYKLGDDNLLNDYTCDEHDINKLCVKNDYYLKFIINELTKRNIQVVLVSPPYFWDYGFDNANKEQMSFLSRYMANLCEEYPVAYLNLESDTTYEYDDFYDESHLSDSGAEKFTRTIDEFVLNHTYKHK